MLGDAAGSLRLGGVTGSGRFIALLTPDAARVWVFAWAGEA